MQKKIGSYLRPIIKISVIQITVPNVHSDKRFSSSHLLQNNIVLYEIEHNSMNIELCSMK